ncbi:uncharacterized protein BDR25DRAFT_363287 [Lindgomyces ingoldianus]|uniref:Uncharacterized protein n=1 Tax=Lindgomyces ingoldianus TaxID=673940 RepID=A0ACB6Q7X5_9PLEO|nr:uncharacterized protein BDR25DRAFT_363287 [Lindgomyces ingoldianus]KAF2462954.1 hypothetical protein BDR25DRAFT_363287 [Lindgomyces ingoldianus]
MIIMLIDSRRISPGISRMKSLLQTSQLLATAGFYNVFGQSLGLVLDLRTPCILTPHKILDPEFSNNVLSPLKIQSHKCIEQINTPPESKESSHHPAGLDSSKWIRARFRSTNGNCSSDPNADLSHQPHQLTTSHRWRSNFHGLHLFSYDTHTAFRIRLPVEQSHLEVLHFNQYFPIAFLPLQFFSTLRLGFLLPVALIPSLRSTHSRNGACTALCGINTPTSNVQCLRGTKYFKQLVNHPGDKDNCSGAPNTTSGTFSSRVGNNQVDLIT